MIELLFTYHTSDTTVCSI